MEDEKILDLYWERQESAIWETARKYGAYCRKIAYHILADIQDAEECENDTYTAAWNAIPPARPAVLKIFLARITRNIALDRYDYNRAQKRNKEFDILLSELGECAGRENVEQEYEAGYAAEAIGAFLREIDPRSRMVFLRRYWYSDSIEEIAERFGMSTSKTKSMLFRVRKKLRAYLREKGVSI